MNELYESIITIVVPAKDDDGNGIELEIRNVGDVLEFRLKNKLIFAGDWTNNFQEVFKRALELWDEKEA